MGVEQTTGLKIKLISDQKAIAPNKPFTLGLHLQHQEGYHTYWKSPGIVGLPTSLTWKLPEGFTASEIQWPYPERTLMAGHPCHGYERDVTLLVTISPPEKILPKEVTFTTSAQWMCCAQNCHPGFKDFSITLEVRKAIQENEKNAKLIKKAKEELPKPLKLAGLDGIVLQSAKDAQTIELLIAPQAHQKPYFFSADGQVSTDKPQSLQIKDDGSIRIIMPRSEYSPEGKTSLPGVLQLGNNYFTIDPTYPAK